MRLFGRHGVLPQEFVVGNIFLYDLEIEYPFTTAAKTDQLSHTLNYAEVIDVIKEVNSTPSKLLENLLWRLDNLLRSRFPEILEMSLSVTKVAPPIPNVELSGVSAQIITLP